MRNQITIETTAVLAEELRLQIQSKIEGFETATGTTIDNLYCSLNKKGKADRVSFNTTIEPLQIEPVVEGH